MRSPLRIAVAQPRIRSGDVGANAREHAEAVRRAGARVVVFPELSLTGYELDAPPVRPDDRRLQPLVEACTRTGTVALVGAPISTRPVGPTESAGPRTTTEYIAVLAVHGGRVDIAYRKMWPGSEESPRFASGNRPAVLVVDNWRLGLAVCRDTGIAEHQRDTMALGVDAYVAGTVMLPSERQEQEERAVRIAAGHGVFVALASFAGATGGGYRTTAGCSGIWLPGGVLAQAGALEGETATAVLDPALLIGPPVADVPTLDTATKEHQ